MKKEIFGIKAPEKGCTDKKCPFHGEINVKKELAKGRVVKKDINHSATIEFHRTTYIPKYERYEKKRSSLRVHNPACIDAEVGQDVLVARTRPMSKSKNHVIIQVISEEVSEKPQEKKAKPVSEEVKEEKAEETESTETEDKE